jgi:predicted ABC-type exoprotein transport system permease subunit
MDDESLEELEHKEILATPVRRKLRASYILNAVLIIIVAFLAYPRIFKRDNLDTSKGIVSVAVTPFLNLQE